MSFPYNAMIPNPPNNPSSDVGQMQTNSGSINSWTQVDHIGFNNSLAGQHTKLTFPGFTNPTPNTPTTPGSIVYTAAGTAITSQAELFIKNSGATLALSALKAFGFVDGTAGTTTGFNATSTITSTGHYTVTLPANLVFGVNYTVLGTIGTTLASLTFGYTIASATSFTVQVRNGVGAFQNPASFSFAVLQL